MSVREQAKSRRRDEIVSAARELMQESGDFAFSMRTLAEQAGVSIATPYNLFGSKQAILLAVLDRNLADYERELAELPADRIEGVFESIGLMTSRLRSEPAFYRNVLSAVAREGGPELGFLISGPRYVLWKRLLGRATASGQLAADVDPDALAISLSQMIFTNIIEWARGTLGVDEFEARVRHGLALGLLGIATDVARPAVDRERRQAEAALQRIWRGYLAARLEAGTLEDEARLVLSDQLAAMGVHTATPTAQALPANVTTRPAGRAHLRPVQTPKTDALRREED